MLSLQNSVKRFLGDYIESSRDAKRICQKAGINMTGQHALRHTFATRCIEAGVSPLALKTWLGHTNIHITLDTYADVFARMNAGAVALLEQHIQMISPVMLPEEEDQDS